MALSSAIHLLRSFCTVLIYDSARMWSYAWVMKDFLWTICLITVIKRGLQGDNIICACKVVYGSWFNLNKWAWQQHLLSGQIGKMAVVLLRIMIPKSFALLKFIITVLSIRQWKFAWIEICSIFWCAYDVCWIGSVSQLLRQRPCYRI